jgi:Raf kinase inhibitor-like YbhB/YbcL family protein
MIGPMIRSDVTRYAQFASLATAALLLAASAEHALAQETMKITSTAFGADAEIPPSHTCDGGDRSPPLAWSGVPASAKSLALVVDDPDAPAPQKPWVHWVLFNLPIESSGLAEAVAPTDLPFQAQQGANDWHRTGYRGPCPPNGRHRYVHKLYALDAVLTGLASPSKAELERAMQGHIVAEAQLVGTYQRRAP